jgi:hypothetical protein
MDPHINPPAPLSELFWESLTESQLAKFETLNAVDSKEYDLIIDLLELGIEYGIERGIAEAASN